MRCLLIGNYGTGNLGDEALKEYFLTRFPEIDWTVLSASPSAPNEVPRLPFGLRSLLTPWWRTLGAFRRGDAVVFGGGSLFTDVESVRACFLWWWHAFVARIFRKPVLLAFQGIGPFRTRIGESLARSVLRHAQFVSVRDAESAARAKVPVIESFDPVFSMFDSASATGDALCVIPRPNAGVDFREAVKNESAKTIKIISMQPDAERRMCESLSADLHAEIVPVHSLMELSAALKGCSRVITARYHGGLAAVALSIPFEAVAQHSGDKLDLLCSAQALGVAELRTRLVLGEQELLKSLNMVK